MKTHELYKYRKHLILDHGWEADRANALDGDEIVSQHDEENPTCRTKGNP